jgi:RHS repeat-associated protein
VHPYPRLPVQAAHSHQSLAQSPGRSPATSFTRSLALCAIMGFAVSFVGTHVAAAQVVMPKGTLVPASPNSSASYTFSVHNDGGIANRYSLTVGRSGSVTQATLVGSALLRVNAGATVNVVVNYQTGGSGDGQVLLTASDDVNGTSDQGEITIGLPSANPQWTQNDATVWTAESESTNYPSFHLRDQGDTPMQFGLSASCTGNVSGCSVSSPSPLIAAGNTSDIVVYFQTGPASNGNGLITLTATSSLGAPATTTLTIVPMSESVTVGVGSPPTPPHSGGSATYGFTVAATGNNTSPITYSLSASCAGSLSCSTTPSPGSVTITPGNPATANVVATANGTAGGTGTVNLSASYTNDWGRVYSSQNSYSVYVPAVQVVTVAAPAGPVFDDPNVTVTRVFTVHNPNSFSGSYAWTATCTQPVTCSGQSGSVGVTAGATSSVNVSYGTSATPGTGSVSFTAGDAAGNATAALSVTLNTYTPGVVPANGESGPLVFGQEVVDTFTVTNQGNHGATYSVSAHCDGAITATCFLANSMQGRNGVQLEPGQTELVPVRWEASGSPATSHVSLTASYTDAHGTLSTNTGTRTLTYYPWVAPSVTADGIPPGGFGAGGIGLIQSFMITNNGSTSATYEYGVSCVDAVGEAAIPASCAIVTPAPSTIAAAATATVQVRFNGGDAGTSSTMTLTATDGSIGGNPANHATGTATIVITQLPTSVTTPTPSVVDFDGVSKTRSFMIHNPNSVSESYSWTTVCHGVASCAPGSGSIGVPARDSASIAATYTPSGAPNATGSIVATASSSAGTASDSIVVRIKSYAVVVTAVGSPATPATGAGATAGFTLKNVGLDSMSYVVTTSCDNTAATQCQPPSSPVSLLPSQQITLSVPFIAGANFTSGGVVLRALPNGSATYADSATFVVNVRSPGALTVSTAFMNNDNQNVGACAASCFAARYAITTVPFYTLGVARTTSIVYNSDRAFPRPFIYADVTPNTGAGTAQQFWLEVRKGGVDLPFTNGETKLIFNGSTVPVRLAGQLDMATYPTDVYAVDVVVTAVYSAGGPETATSHVGLLVVNEADSPVAKGWSVVGPQHIYERDSLAIVTDGTGSAEVFLKCGMYCYQTPAGDFSTLCVADSSVGATRSWIRQYPDGTALYFGNTGDNWMTTDPTGRGVYTERDDRGRVTAIAEPQLWNVARWDAGLTQFQYGSNGISSIQEPSQQAWTGRTINFRIGTDSLLYAAYQPNGDSTVFGYDAQHRLSTVRDMNGAVTTYSYQPVTWKVIQITSPAVPTDAGNGSTTLASAAVVLTPWQGIGTPTGLTASIPATPINASAVVAQVRDAAGSITRFTVDRWGQPLVTTDPMGNVTTITRTGMFPTQIDESQGRVSFYTYDGPRLTMSKPAGDSATYYHYGVRSQVDSIWGAGVVAEQRGLNSNGTVAWVRQAGDVTRTTTYTYDPVTVQVDTLTDPLGHRTVMEYDPVFGTLSRTTTPDGQVVSTTFDRYGRDSTTTRTAYATTTTLYDIMNRPVSVSDGYNPSPTTFTYDPLGRFTIVTDPMGQSYRTEYDTLGRMTRRFDATGSGKFNSYRYDIAGRTTSTTNRGGHRVDVTYDSLGRTLTRTDVTSGAADRFTYSADGLTSGAINANAGDTTVVNVLAGTSQTTTWENGVQYVNGQTMNQSFNVPDTSTVTALTFGGHPSIRITSRDPLLGALGGVSLGGRTTTFGYDYRQNARTLTTYLPSTVTAGGSARADSYAPLTGLPTETAFSVPRVDSVLHRAYGYDSVGRLASEQVAINSYTDGDGARERQRQFSYDSLGRLKSVVVRRGTCMPWPSNNVAPDSLSASFGWRYTCGVIQPDSGATYSYDAVGNRADHGAVIAAGNRLVKFNGDTITYDDDGNMTRRYNPVSGADHRYVWNALGQLDSAIVTSGSALTTVAEHYSYDASGRLVHIDRGDPSQNWMVYQGDQISELIQSPTYYTDVAYDDGTDRPALEYTHGLPSDVWHAQIIDVMGNVAGAVVADTVGMPYTWDVWGQNTSTASDGTEVLGWKGLPTSTGSGLVYMRARWYDPALGRFLSEDPIGLSGGLNQYAFAGDDPVNASDPSGAVVTDAQGTPCSFYAASCGDPLQMPGGAGYGAVMFALLSGPSGGDVRYASASVAHGLIIVDRNLQTALDAYVNANPLLQGYLTTLEESANLYVILDSEQHPAVAKWQIDRGWSYGGMLLGASEQPTVDAIASELGYTGVLGISLIAPSRAADAPLGKIVAHEAAHLLGLEYGTTLYSHAPGNVQGPFKQFGCTLINCH